MKKLLILSVVAIMAAGVYFTVNSSLSQKSDLVSKNIEALSGSETSTSWYCEGSGKNCGAGCTQCGTSVSSGRGQLKGTHSCQ